MSLEDLVEAISEKIIMIQFEELYKQLHPHVTNMMPFEEFLEIILEGGKNLADVIQLYQQLLKELQEDVTVADKTNLLTFIGLLKSYEEHLRAKEVAQ
jgi:DNA repair protein RadC